MKRNVEVKPEIRAAFEAKVRECIGKAEAASGKKLPVFPVVFRQMGERAGVCSISLIGPTVLYINPDFFKNHYDEQLNDTTPHEVAHGIVHELWPPFKPTDGLSQLVEAMRSRNKVKPHGVEWQRVMGWLGIHNPKATHRMDMTGVATRKKADRPFNYVCGCGCPHKLTLTLHKRIQEQGQKRICKMCRQRLVYERLVGKPERQPAINLNTRRYGNAIIVEVNPPVPKPKPLPAPTHKVVTRLVGGMLVNERIPL